MAKPTPFQFKTLLVLGRMSNLPTVWSNLMLGWLMGQTEPSFEVLAWLCLGGSLIYTGGMYLNDAFDVRFDRSFRPERPIPSGAISLGWVRFLGWFQLIAGSVILSVGSQVGLGWILALNASVIAYNAFHKRMVFSPVMMAACRFFLLMAAYSAESGQAWRGAALWPSFALGSYIVGLTYVAKRESTGGVIAWWPCLFLYFPILMAGFMHQSNHWLTLCLPATAFLLWSLWCLRHIFWGSKSHIGRTVSGLLAGMPMVDMLFLSSQHPVWMLICAAWFLVALLFQRFVPAT